ncbi:NADH-quinone oxidoreductase subunit L [Deinococcus pimensis]|uniref:NADH-quinone oxidoreductase subunit L n=1 Tax=Deinococcus pimensis TaxID=309888 RepID=UPI0004B63A74|nr:NADH-quinone oxidoreductase subunit L [Deinococcus pimensis]
MSVLPLWLYPLFPLLGFAVLILGGRFLRGTTAGWIASGAVLASFVVAALNYLNLGAPRHDVLWSWLPGVAAEGRNLSVGFYLDQLSAVMTLVVTGVGFLIHVFSIEYMRTDPRFARFFAFLNFFVSLMLILVLADSYPLMFVGWEGVGLASYLLIGFWFAGHHDHGAVDGVNNSNAARKAFIMNRVGDLGFMLGMFLMFQAFGTLVIPQLFEGGAELQAGRATFELICLFLLVGAVGKSAQLPLTTWLPDAMAGPTPVSALIHAATMVTAGVYLVARSHPLFEQAPAASTWVAVIGALTALYGAISALNQYDIKKILAFSTVSQLGYMFLAVGLGAYTAGIFHLVTHAFFKALLFLAAGSVIHALSEEQDVRRMGGLARKLPLTHAVSLIGVLAISGIPIFAGFFSKDAILAGAYEAQPILWGVGLLVALLTAFYMGRWYFLVFRGQYRGSAHPHEGGPLFAVPLVTLAVLSVVGGFIGLPHFLGFTNRLEGYLGRVLPVEETTLTVGAEWALTLAAVAVGVIGLGVAYLRHRAGTLADGPLRNASLRALYLDDLYDGAVGRPSRALGAAFDAMDRGVDGAVVGTAEVLAEPSGRAASFWESGYVRTYAVSMLLGTAAVMLYWAFRALGGHS